jgi:hypothetical protein
VTVIRGGIQGTATAKLGDQATRFERVAAQQLGPAYADYLTLQVCAERLRQFDRPKTRLGAYLKTEEAAYSIPQWPRAAAAKAGAVRAREEM